MARLSVHSTATLGHVTAYFIRTSGTLSTVAADNLSPSFDDLDDGSGTHYATDYAAGNGSDLDAFALRGFSEGAAFRTDPEPGPVHDQCDCLTLLDYRWLAHRVTTQRLAGLDAVGKTAAYGLRCLGQDSCRQLGEFAVLHGKIAGGYFLAKRERPGGN